jgi:hypothetical protein
MDGGDGGWAVLDGSSPPDPSGGAIEQVVDEDRLRDSERNHTTEQVASFVIDPPARLSSASLEALGFSQLLVSTSTQVKRVTGVFTINSQNLKQSNSEL